MRNMLDFSSWQGMLSTLLGLVLVTFVAVGIRLLAMQHIQQRRERQNRQINERLKTLIAAYKTLGGSFTGNLAVDPRHMRDLRMQAAEQQGESENPPHSERRRRIRDAVEAALSDVILLGTTQQVRLAVRRPTTWWRAALWRLRRWWYRCATSSATYWNWTLCRAIWPYPGKAPCAHLPQDEAAMQAAAVRAKATDKEEQAWQLAAHWALAWGTRPSMQPASLVQTCTTHKLLDQPPPRIRRDSLSTGPNVAFGRACVMRASYCPLTMAGHECVK